MKPWRPAWQPSGTVYGTLLNFRREWDLWSPRMTQDPHKAAPQAPVLYVKTANTWTPHGQTIAVPASVPQVEIGATAGLVMGAANTVAQVVLMNDLSVPHASFFRPPVKFKCLDGFLGIGAQAVALASVADLSALPERYGSSKWPTSSTAKVNQDSTENTVLWSQRQVGVNHQPSRMMITAISNTVGICQARCRRCVARVGQRSRAWRPARA